MKNRLVIVAAVAILAACGGGGDDKHDVQYDIAGSTNLASLTYATANGGTAQTDAALPTRVRLGEVAEGAFLYISAQNERSSGSVVVTILVDGKPWKTTTSSGAYVIATASGTCC